ncbi:hypothetical protein [Methylocaldum sp.]|jgi:hypothetical protein|uniref:hypothetical protein n=1 Tax=Methylocaldum sp. TaxID=1969727 RepID=UPI00321FF707
MRIEQVILFELKAGGSLWSPVKAKIAYLCLADGRNVRVVRRSTLEKLAARGILEADSEGEQYSDTYWRVSQAIHDR